MGNCQAAEAATVVIQHPGGKVERVYWSVSASDVMGSNPGHYVAAVLAAPPHAAPGHGSRGPGPDAPADPVRHLKLLRPDDTLHIGHVYRLVSFEEVLKEFAAKKHVKLRRLLLTQQQRQEKEKKKKRDAGGSGRRARDGTSTPCESSSAVVEHQQQLPRDREEEDAHATTMDGSGSNMMSSSRLGGGATRHGQWRPSLHSIAEAGS
uniref:UPF0213 protein SG0387 n=1 Tax=Anthurium amnicola TaxID=1678845 RepID=A0A1D1YSX1_9ARAE